MPRAYLTPAGDYVKVCSRQDCELAGIAQPADILHFVRSARYLDGLQTQCKSCWQRYRKENQDKIRAGKRDYGRRRYIAQKRNLGFSDQKRVVMRRAAPGPKKVCTSCFVSWPAIPENFSRHPKHRDGLQSRCRRCVLATGKLRARTLRGLLLDRHAKMRRRAAGRSKTQLYRATGKPIVSRDEFVAWGLAHPDYLRLHAKWVESDYVRRLSPSIDRIDPDKGYTLDNMQWLTVEENTRKGGGQDYILRTLRSAKKKIAPGAKLNYNGLDV